MLSIRRYADTDLDAVIAVFRAAVTETAARDYSPRQVAAWSEVDRAGWATRRRAADTWVATLNGDVIGFSGLLPDGLVDMMFVHPAHGGHGVASALLAHIEAHARAAGLSRLWTEASLTARPFFERRGFLVTTAQTVEKRGVTLPNFRMEKALGA